MKKMNKVKVNMLLQNCNFMLMLDLQRDQFDFPFYMQYLILVLCLYNLLLLCYDSATSVQQMM